MSATNRYSTQVILVSGQPTPNLTPALDPDLGTRTVIMMVSPDMRQRAEALASVLQPAGIQVKYVDLPNPYDVPAMREQWLELLADNAPESLVLNLTGGTKLMAVAAYEAFLNEKLPVFYVHPDRNELIWLQPARRPPQTLATRIRLPAFLQAHGVRCESRPGGAFGMPEPLRALANTLVKNVGSFQRALATLNYAAMDAVRDDSLRSGPLPRRSNADLDALIRLFEDESLLTVETTDKGDCLRFHDEQARFFVNGGWLEQYVVSVVQSLKAEIRELQDIGRGLEVVRSSGRGDARNELDVAILAHNRLHLIECKTRQFRQDAASQSGAGAEAIYKLDALHDLLGGLQARAMLVSYQPIPEPDLRRAREHRILTCVGSELAHLQQRLQDWLSPG